jgi:hypothetical protein
MAAGDEGSLEVDVADSWNSIIGATSVVSAAAAMLDEI